jgi:phage repressor protein C with HTH and peptisase S24 domain
MSTPNDALKDRLLFALERSKRSQAELAQYCNVTQSAVSMWLNGRTKSIRGSNLLSAAEYLRVKPSWLSKGGEFTSLPGGSQTEFEVTQYVMVPRYSYQVTADNGQEIGHVAIQGAVPFSREWLAEKKLPADKLKVYEAKGEGMSPHIENGDLVLVDTSPCTPLPADILVIYQPLPLGTRVKRLLYRETGEVLIRSDNTDKSRFPDELVPADRVDAVYVVGKVVWRGG